MRRYCLIFLLLFFGLLPLQAQDLSVADIVIQSASAEDAEFTILLLALSQGDSTILEMLSEPNAQVTIFAPSDEAFIRLLNEHQLSVGDLLARPALLNDILAYHVLGEILTAGQLSSSESISPILPDSIIRLSSQRDVIRLNESARVVVDSIAASNGLIHVIDRVLVPEIALDLLNTAEATPEASTEMNLAELLQSREDLSTLTVALELNGLLEILSDTNRNFSLFAPTNEAFVAAELSAETISGEILLYHAFDSRFYASDFASTANINSLQGAAITITVSSEGLVLNNTALVEEVDIEASNGVLHVINAVLAIPVEEVTPEATEAEN